MTLAEVKALDAGSWFGERFTGERVPTLREVLVLCSSYNVIVHIELKDPFLFQGIEQQVVDLIHELQRVRYVQIRSFDHESLQRVYQLAPEIAIAELWGHQLPDDRDTCFKTICAYYAFYTPEALARIHKRGQKATAWTVNEPAVAQELIEAGIDGLTTDYPDRLLDLVHRREG
jgi:glycerophosphoryl diester phosphodiesterase